MVEGEELEPVVCAGSGSPPLSFYWTLREEVVAEGDTLTLLQPVERGQAGEYLCHGANKHGESLASLTLSVLHRPQCQSDRPSQRRAVFIIILILRFTDLHLPRGRDYFVLPGLGTSKCKHFIPSVSVRIQQLCFLSGRR